REEISGYPEAIYHPHPPLRRQVEIGIAERGDAGEKSGMIAELLPERVRDLPVAPFLTATPALSNHADLNQLFRMLDRQTTDEKCVDQLEDGGIGADAERERQNPRGSEHRIALQLPRAVAQVGEQIEQPAGGPHIAGHLLNQSYVAEIAKR